MPANADRPYSSTASRLLLVGLAIALMAAAVLFVLRRMPDGAPALSLTFRAFPSVSPLPGGETLIPCDLDGDGRGDFILKNQPRPVVWLSRGDGTFDTIMFPFGGPTEIPLVPADLDGDRSTDFLLTDQADRFLILRNFDFVWPTGEFHANPDALPATRIPPDGGGKILRRQEGVFFGITYHDAEGLVGPGAGAAVVAGDVDGNHVADFLVQPGRDLPEPSEEPPAALGAHLPWPRF